MSVDASPFAPITWSTQANGLPILTSFPTAPAMIYLDYDGDASQNISELDLDNTPGVFSAFEQQRIVEHWRGLSAVYSMFNVGVTTVQPNTAAVPTEWISITNDMLGKGGVNGVGTFPDTAPSGVSGADWWAEGYSHEIGHGFGNWHQSSYDLLGNKTAEYGAAPTGDTLHGAIMGAGPGVIAKWVYGHSSLDGKTIQADVDIISGSINAIDGAGDGYRPDDQLGTSTATATALTAVDSTTQAKIGIIERLTDQDWYSFTSAGGTYNILVGRDNPSPVDVKTSIYNSAGMLIATDDGDPLTAVTEGSANYRTMVNDSHLTMSLAAGTYYVKVESHGNYDDLGQYIVRVDRMMGGWQSKDIGLVESPGFTDYDPSTGTFAVGGSGRGMGGTLANGGDGVQFAYTKLVGDGEFIARVASIENVTSIIRAGITMRESLATGSKFFAVYATPSSHVTQQRRSSTDGNSSSQTASSAPSGPVWLRVKRVGDTFTAYYSINGTNWTTVSSSVTVSMNSELYVGLLSTSANDLDRLTSNYLSTATFTNVKVIQQADIGDVGVTGSTDYNAATGLYTLKGNGAGWGNISGQQDASHVYYHTLAGDGSIMAHVANISSTSATSGVMIRESLNTNSKYFATWLKPNQGVVSSFRTATGGTSNETVITPASYWLRVERSGNVFRSYTSTDGAQWTQVGVDQLLAMNSNAIIGLMVATGNTITTNTTTFDNLALTGGIDITQALSSSLAAPTNVSVSGITSTGMTVSWTNPNAPLPGDYTQDGAVNAADFVSWRRNDGTQTGYNNWRTNFEEIQPTVTGFMVERSSNNVDFESIGTTTANVLTFTDSNLDGSQKYYYRVRTSGTLGYSAPSAIVGGTTRAAAVTGLKVTSYSTNQLVIEWLDASGETDYTLQRSTNGTTWTTIGSSTITKNTSVYVNPTTFGSALSAGTKYYYRVTTVDGTGNSATSAVVSAYTRLSSGTPSVTFGSQTASSITLSWNANASLTNYAVYRGRNNGINEWDLLDSNITTTSFTDTGLSPLTEYHYRVVGYNANGAATQTAEIFGASGATAPVPSPWVSQEIGAVGGVGDAGYSNGTFTLIGGGADIWGTSDAFHYVYAPMSGDGYIVARVAAMKDPAVNYYSRAGLMIRESTAIGSKQVSLMLHSTDAGVRLQSRSSDNGGTAEIPGPTTTRSPYWLLLSRSGTTITGKISPDGSTWTTVGSVDVSMSTSVLIGMALTPRDNAYMHWAAFDHVSSTVTGTGAPGLESEPGAAFASTESLPDLPESVFASGAVGAFGASSIWQTLAMTACQCCAFDCDITPLGSPQQVQSVSGSFLTTDQPGSGTQSLLKGVRLGGQLAHSLSALANAPGRSFTSPTAFPSLKSMFSHGYRRALDDAFARLEFRQQSPDPRKSLLDSIASHSEQSACDEDASSDNETQFSLRRDRIRAGEQEPLTENQLKLSLRVHRRIR